MPGSSFILHTRAGRKISELPFGASQSPIYFCSLPALATGVTDHAGESEAVSSKNCMTTFRSRSEEHTSELQSLMRISYAVFCLTKKKQAKTSHTSIRQCMHKK